MADLDQVSLRTTLLASLPAAGAAVALWWGSRGFVGESTWAALWCGLPQGPRLLDPACPSPLTSTTSAWLAGGGDALPVMTALGLSAALVAVVFTALAVRRVGEGAGAVAAAALLCAAWPGLGLWSAGGPGWAIAAAFAAFGVWTVSGRDDPRGAVVAGMVWGLATLARPEAMLVGPLAAAWSWSGGHRHAAQVSVAAWASMVAVVLGTRLAAGGIPWSPSGPLLPVMVPLAPLVAVAAAPSLGGRVRASLAIAAGVALTLAQGLLVAPLTWDVDQVALVDAAIGKAITQLGEPGDTVVAVRTAPLRPYAPDARIGTHDAPRWIVSEISAPGRAKEAVVAVLATGRLPSGPEVPAEAAYVAIGAWARSSDALAVLSCRADALPDTRVPDVPPGMGPPVELSDGTVFHGGVLAPAAFAGEAVLVDAYFTPPEGTSSRRVAEIEVWPVGASAPVVQFAHLAGAGGYPPDQPGGAIRDRARVPIPPSLRPGRYYVTWRMRSGGPVLEAPPFHRGRVQVGIVEVRRRSPRWWIPPTDPAAQRAPLPTADPPIRADGPTLASGGTLVATGPGDDGALALGALARADLVTANLARLSPDRLGLLYESRIALAATASDDAGDPAAWAVLDEMGIGHPGSARTLTLACQPAYRHVHGVRVAVFAVDASKPELAATATRPGHCFLDPVLEEAWFQRMVSRIGAARVQADVVLVSVHWPAEGAHRPSSDIRKAAHALVDAGADAVLGHSGDYVQGIEVYRGRPILYDQGALLADAEARSAVFTLVLNRYGVRQIRIDPVTLTPGLTVASEGNDASQTLRRVRDLSALLGTRVVLWDDVGLVTLPDPPVRDRPRLRLDPNPAMAPPPAAP